MPIKDLLCPDIHSFDVLGGVTGTVSLELDIKATEKSINDETIDSAWIIVYDVTTVFEPSDYLEKGYEQPVTLREKLIYPK